MASNRFTKASVDVDMYQFLLVVASAKGVSFNTLLEKLWLSYMEHEETTTTEAPAQPA